MNLKYCIQHIQGVVNPRSCICMFHMYYELVSELVLKQISKLNRNRTVYSLLILARMSPRGRNLGVKAEFLHSDPRDLVDSPNSRWSPHIVDKS